MAPDLTADDILFEVTVMARRAFVHLADQCASPRPVCEVSASPPFHVDLRIHELH